TDALVLALMAMSVGAGDAVFVPDYTFFATAEAPAFLGATPVFVDIDPDTYNMSPASLEKCISQVKAAGKLQPKAVIPVDLFGLPADYRAISAIAKAHGLLVLEDAAQGFGGNMDGKRACSFGDIAATSFFPAKPLGCYGDGGALFTNDDTYAGKLRSLRVHGKGKDVYDNIGIGTNSRLDTLQAAILCVKLDAFASYELDAVQRIAERYTGLLNGTVKTPVIPEGYLSSWAQYCVVFDTNEKREQAKARMEQNGVPYRWYYLPLSMQKAFLTEADTPVAKDMSKRMLALPMSPYLTNEDMDHVCECIV
ncbi:DegT/DnrJ/EryC1/StrS family aminotransferase, partial [Christensenellaceae bacterium OttesenSCG-928-K19]|nr:DegT/DnrJ/EryC1/StrS family aminotransferase [Christensenellaceae bacterium OttesenSCG-928-K19]